MAWSMLNLFLAILKLPVQQTTKQKSHPMEQDHDTLTVLVEQPIQAIQRWAFTINKYEAWIKYPETKGMSMEGVADWIEKHADPKDREAHPQRKSCGRFQTGV